jgi:hypothetical protein
MRDALTPEAARLLDELRTLGDHLFAKTKPAFMHEPQKTPELSKAIGEAATAFLVELVGRTSVSIDHFDRGAIPPTMTKSDHKLRAYRGSGDNMSEIGRATVRRGAIDAALAHLVDDVRTGLARTRLVQEMRSLGIEYDWKGNRQRHPVLAMMEVYMGRTWHSQERYATTCILPTGSQDEKRAVAFIPGTPEFPWCSRRESVIEIDIDGIPESIVEALPGRSLSTLIEPRMPEATLEQYRKVVISSVEKRGSAKRPKLHVTLEPTRPVTDATVAPAPALVGLWNDYIGAAAAH